MNDRTRSQSRTWWGAESRTRTPAQGPSRPSGADAARGIAALLLLAAFVAGIPALLLAVSPIRTLTLPTWSEMTDSITRPDDGHLFLAALAMLAWLAWAAFTVCVVVEAVAVVRGLPSPRLPFLGPPQRAASALVAAAAVILSIQPIPAVAPASFHEVSATAVTTGHPTSLAPRIDSRSGHPASAARTGTPPGSAGRASSTRTGAAPKRAATHKTVTVRRGDTLWGLAVQHLGSGSRYAEIAKLNYGRVQSDGRALTEAHWIYPGWVLQLPADAAGVRQASAIEASTGGAATAATGGSYTVRQADTLWGIAERHLGDGERYREIYQLNAGKAQEVGGRLSDPDVILPGWVLRLPAVGSADQAPPRRAETQPTSPAVPATSVPTTKVPPDLPSTGTSPFSAGADETGGGVGAPASAHVLDESSLQLERLVLGLTVLASAGLLGELARRRRRQQRLRRPGERIPLPVGEAAIVERTLRTGQDPVSLETLRTALAALATSCRSSGRELPRVMAVRISADDLELLIDDDGEAVEPFRRVVPGTWRLDRSWQATPLGVGDDSKPYPALVTVGVAGASVVLLNLEAAGRLTVVGEDRLAQDVVRALAVELATSSTADRTVLILPDWLSELAEVSDVSRVHTVTNSEAVRRIATHRANAAAILAESGVNNLHEARSRDVAADTWTPEIFLEGPPVDVAPWSGVVVIAAGQDSASGWTLEVDLGGRGRLDPLAIDLDVQRISADGYDSVISLLGSADDEPESSTQLPDHDLRGGAFPEPSSGEVPKLVHAALPPAPLSTIGDCGEQSDMAMAPRVLVLGRVQIEGTTEGVSSNRRARAAELVAYLALHPGGSAHEIDEAIWPGRRVTKDVRNSFVSRVRHWLGNAPDGQPYLPMVGEHGDYRLSPEVRCDWHDFLTLSRMGLERGTEGAESLQEALAVVRGRPFLGIDPVSYMWAEPDTQEMISAIVDVAHCLAVVRLDQGDGRASLRAAAAGLKAEPCSEVLHRDAIAAALSNGDVAEAQRWADRLRVALSDLDPDAVPEAETLEMLRQLATSNVPRRSDR